MRKKPVYEILFTFLLDCRKKGFKGYHISSLSITAGLSLHRWMFRTTINIIYLQSDGTAHPKMWYTTKKHKWTWQNLAFFVWWITELTTVWFSKLSFKMWRPANRQTVCTLPVKQNWTKTTQNNLFSVEFRCSWNRSSERWWCQVEAPSPLSSYQQRSWPKASSG